MTITAPAYIIDPDAYITVTYADGFHETVYRSHERFDQILAACVEERWEFVRHLITLDHAILMKAVEQPSSENDDITIEAGVVKVNGVPLHNSLTDRIIKMKAAGFNIKPMVSFLTNLMNNPSHRAVNELYSFMEKGNLPITEDGHFLAYKRINHDWTDVHTGKIDNSIGRIVEMPRNKVNDDKDQTCSSGLHFCSRAYLASFSGARLIVLKINPADVVSIPSDYNETKGRCCRYLVIQEIESINVKENLEHSPVAITKSNGVEYELEPMQLGANVFPDVPTPTENRIISRISVDGNVVNTFNSIQQASDATGIPTSIIATDIMNGWKPGQFGWMLHEATHSHTQQPQVNDTDRIVQQLVESTVIEEYSSIDEAAEVTGIRKEYIQRVLTGDRKSTHGFGWAYGDKIPTNSLLANHYMETDEDFQDDVDDVDDYDYNSWDV